MQLKINADNSWQSALRGQSSLEYAVIIICLVAGLLAMQVYIKRSMQGRLRQAADELGQQYAPKNTTSDITVGVESDMDIKVETEEKDGKIKTTTTTTINYENESRTGTETVAELESSLF